MTDLRATILMTLALSALVGCGGTKSEEPPVADPRAYAIDALRDLDLNTWWQAYRNDDPAFLAKAVDEVAAKTKGGLPTARGKLDLLVRNRIAGRYKLSMDDEEEGRAYILARAKARFANPPSAAWDRKGRHALLDYHILPGVWKPISRISEGLKEPEAIAAGIFLDSRVLARSLAELKARHPRAEIFQIRYEFHLGSDLKKVLIQIRPDAPIVLSENGHLRFTAESVPWRGLIDGSIELAKLAWDSPMEGVDAPRIEYPPKEPLPDRETK